MISVICRTVITHVHVFIFSTNSYMYVSFQGVSRANASGDPCQTIV